MIFVVHSQKACFDSLVVHLIHGESCYLVSITNLALLKEIRSDLSELC